MTAVRLSAVVMTHPRRLPEARRLCERHPELDLGIVVDPAPGEPGGALRTARLAWDAVAPDATHHLVLQDDTRLCDSFRAHLERAVAARPGEALSLYTEWGSETSYAVRLAALLGGAWAEVVDRYVPTQALVLPAEVARAFRGSGHSGLPTPAGPLDDFAMRAYLAAAGVPARIAVPNLADDARLPSLIGHDPMGDRASVCFPAGEPIAPDWSTDVVAPAAVPAFAWTTGLTYTVLRAGRNGSRVRVPHPVTPRYGRPAVELLELGRAAVRGLSPRARSAGPRLLLELWLTAYGLGSVAADLGAPDTMLARPQARRALATMPPGALRFLVDDDLLAGCHAELVALVEAAVRHGHSKRTVS